MLGLDPASTSTLVAHRLGKRAVRRIKGADGTCYARLRPVTSESGRRAHDKHFSLFKTLEGASPLQVPRPLGFDPEICLALLDSLPGTPPTFRRLNGYQTVASVMRAIAQLQSLTLLAPPHTAADGLSRRMPDARLDAQTRALFQAFPQDNRLPQLARFLAWAMQRAPTLLGGPAAGPPRLIRYRPGLSATLRWTATDGRAVYVKQTPAEDVADHAATLARLIAISEGQGLGFTPVTGMIPVLGLIAHAAASGAPMV